MDCTHQYVLYGHACARAHVRPMSFALFVISTFPFVIFPEE